MKILLCFTNWFWWDFFYIISLAVLWLWVDGIILFRCLFLFCLEHRRHPNHSSASCYTIEIGDFLENLSFFLPLSPCQSQLMSHAELVKEWSLTSFKLTIGFTIPITIPCCWCLKVHLWMVHVCYRSHCVVVALAEFARFGPYCKQEKKEKDKKQLKNHY